MPESNDLPSSPSPLDEDMEDLYENAPCGYLSTLPNGVIVKVNATFLEWTGYQREMLLDKKRFQELLPITGRIFYDTHFEPLLQMQGFVKEMAFEIISANGQRLPTLLNSTLKRSQDGTPLLIRTTLLDARSRRTYEQELLKARRRAEAKEAEVRHLNDTLEQMVALRTAERDRLWRLAQEILAIGTMDGRFINVNPAFSAVLGWTLDDVQELTFEKLVPADQRDEFRANLIRLQQGTPLMNTVVRRQHRDGSCRWISWNIVPDDGLLIMVGRDVTAEHLQAEALRNAEESLRQAKKMEAIGQLTAGIAHDFNNLLAGVVGNLQLMRIRLQQGRQGDVFRHIDAAEDVSDKAAAITQRLLSFSRHRPLSPQRTDLNERVECMRELMQSTVGPRIGLQLHVDKDLYPTLCDPNQLDNALLNLAINARDAMTEGGKLVCTTENRHLSDGREAARIGLPAGDYATITVSDTGVGMTPEVLERALDPFFTTKPLGQGTGLGLSMIYGFAKQSAGQVHITSTPGVGTSVSLWLPRYSGELMADESRPDALEVQADAVNGTVLLVDDETPLRTLLSEILVDSGFEVLAAENAEGGLQLLESVGAVDILITDVALPGKMDGKQFARLAQAMNPALKVMFITGYADSTKTDGNLLDTGLDVMIKPFRLEEFISRVSRLGSAR